MIQTIFFVGSRKHPICSVPEIGIGNKPIDGGYYLFDKEEMEEFIKQEPKSQSIFTHGMEQENLLIVLQDIVYIWETVHQKN